MPDDIQLSFLSWLTDNDATRQDNYRAYREYYDGQHDTQLTERQRRYLQIKTGVEFNDNYAPIVVDALAERLTVTGFDAGKGDLPTLLWDWWQRERMDATQKVMHKSAVRDGDAYMIISWDNDSKRPRFTPELAYAGSSGVKVHYSNERRGVVDFASRRWVVDQGSNAGKVRRMNLYYPDRIEKYISNSEASEGNWQPYDDGSGAWPNPWVNKRGEPLGVPVVHFKNNDQGYDYGTSELAPMIPLQNALNKTIIDLLAAADTTSFRMLYMIGDDPSGITVSPGGWLYSLRPPSGENGAAIGFIPGENLTPVIALKDSFVVEIARVTRTPMHYFQTSGQRAAEGTLKQEEVGLVSRAEDRQVTFGNAWEDAMMLAIRLSNTFGGTALDEEQMLTTLWAQAEIRNEQVEMQNLKVKSELGIPQEQVWREMGYNDDQIATMRQMKEQEAASSANSLALALLRQQREFDQGQGEEEEDEEEEQEMTNQ